MTLKVDAEKEDNDAEDTAAAAVVGEVIVAPAPTPDKTQDQTTGMK